MDKCKKCSKKFKWKTIIKSTWLNSYSPVTCDACNSKNYQKFSTRLITSISVVFPLIVINHFYIKLGLYTFMLYILWGAFVIVVSPFYARFYIKENIVE